MSCRKNLFLIFTILLTLVIPNVTFPSVTAFNYSDFSSTDGLELISSAVQSNNRLRLGNGAVDGAGGAYYTTKQSISQGFVTTFQFQIMSGWPDGFAFVIQNDNITSLFNHGGGWLGYRDIPNSLAIEFDTYYNADFADPNNNHISVQTRGTLPNSVNHTYSLGSTTSIPTIADGQVHTIIIKLILDTLNIYVDNLTTPVLSVTVNFATVLSLDDGKAWVGFTSTSTTEILNWSFTVPESIEVTTNLSSATFTISGPANYSGVGTLWTKTGAPIGDYTITYGDVPGYITPAPETKTLALDGSIHFTEKYIPIGYIFKQKWGVYGSGDSEFIAPSGIEIDSSGNVFVADTNLNRIQKFSSTGTLQSKFETSGELTLIGPKEIAIDSSENLFILENQLSPSYNRIQKLSSSGTFITEWGTLGSNNGEFSGASGIAVSSLGNVYIADTENNRIQKFSAGGTFLSLWGSSGTGNGQFNKPKAVAVDSYGNVYVADTDNNRIQEFTATGDFLAKWGSSGSGDGQFNSPQGIAVDSFGDVYVSDTNNNCIQKFTPDGTFTTKFGGSGILNGKFDHPCGVAVSNDGLVYVTDTQNYRVQVFEASTTGTVSVTTNNSSAAFELTGPTTYSGSGTLWSQTDAFIGDYTITYGDLDGYITPASDTKTLAAGETVIFTGTYTQITQATTTTTSTTSTTTTSSSTTTSTGDVGTTTTSSTDSSTTTTTTSTTTTTTILTGCGENPTILKISSHNGTYKDKINITGTDFCDSKGSVIFKKDKKEIDAEILSWSQTQIAVTVPWGCGLGGNSIEVITLSGNNSNSKFLNFKKVKPRITKLGSTSDSIGSGITINGTNFGEEEGIVKFGIKSAKVLEWSNENITVAIPDIELGKKGYKMVPIKVETRYAKSNGKWFKVLE